MAGDAIRGPRRYDYIYYASGNACMDRFGDKSIVYFDRFGASAREPAGIFSSSDGTGYLNFEKPSGHPKLIVTVSEIRYYSADGALKSAQPFEKHGKPARIRPILIDGPAGLKLHIRGRRNIEATIPGVKVPIEIAVPHRTSSRSKQRLEERARLAKAMERAAAGDDATPGSLAPYVVVDRAADDPGFHPTFAVPLPKFSAEERRKAAALKRERREALTSHGALDTTAKRLKHAHAHGLQLDRPSGSGRELRDVAEGLLPLARQGRHARTGAGTSTAASTAVHDPEDLLKDASAHIGATLHPQGGRGRSMGAGGDYSRARRAQARRHGYGKGREAEIAGVIATMSDVTARLRSDALVSGVTSAKRAVESSAGTAASLADGKTRRARALETSYRRLTAGHRLECGAKVRAPRPPRELPPVKASDLMAFSEGLRPGTLLVAVLVSVAPGVPQAKKAAALVAEAMQTAIRRQARGSNEISSQRSSQSTLRGSTGAAKHKHPDAGTTRSSGMLQSIGRASMGSTGGFMMSKRTGGNEPMQRSLIRGVRTALHPRAEGKDEHESAFMSRTWGSAAGAASRDSMRVPMQGGTRASESSELQACLDGFRQLAKHGAGGGRPGDYSPFEFVQCPVGGASGRALLQQLGFRAAPVLVVIRQGKVVFAGRTSFEGRDLWRAEALARQCFHSLGQ